MPSILQNGVFFIYVLNENHNFIKDLKKGRDLKNKKKSSREEKV